MCAGSSSCYTPAGAMCPADAARLNDRVAFDRKAPAPVFAVFTPVIDVTAAFDDVNLTLSTAARSGVAKNSNL